MAHTSMLPTSPITSKPTRVTYNPTQLSAYFDRISLPASKRILDVKDLGDDEKLQYLSLLQKHELVNVPWENLDQHYSWHHVVHVEPQHLFRKIVEARNGRGGYCMEANSFMGTVLLSLGFEVYTAGSRIWSPAAQAYGGWTHVVNLVTIGNTKYLIDGGYGSMSSPIPLPLIPEKIHPHIAPASMRLLHSPISQNLDQSQKLWVYQHRISDAAEWDTGYCFTELEFLPEDVRVVNLDPATSRHSFFTHKVVCVRMTTAGEDLEKPGAGEAEMEKEIDGALVIFHNTLRWRRNGHSVIKRELTSEQERLDALEKYFGIQFKEFDRAGINGMASELVVTRLEP